MSTVQAGELLQTRYAVQLNQRQTKQDNGVSSIENDVGNTTNNTSIETAVDLPQEIRALITGSDFWVKAKSNRYRKLIRDGHLDKLMQLTIIARTKNNPAHWFAKACSKVAWERTLTYFAKLHEVAQKAETVARRIGTKVNRFIYKQIWKGVNVERWAIQAEEVSHSKQGQSKVRHFVWLCLHENELTKGGAISTR